MTVLAAIVVIGTAVVIHELGHALAAKAAGIGVRAFSVGWGPILWRRQVGETEYRLSAIPLGGYVDLEGMAPEARPDGSLLSPRTGFAAAPILARLWVLVAGPAMNLVLGVVLLTLTIAQTGLPVEGKVRLAEVLPGSGAERAGLRTGDVIVALNGRSPVALEDLRNALLRDGEIVFQVERDGAPVAITTLWAPEPVAGERPLFGIRYGPAARPAGLGEAAVRAIAVTPVIAIQTAATFVRTIVGVVIGSVPEGVTGPVGIVSAVADATRSGWIELLGLMVALNFSFGVFNLLPVPFLDGGRIALQLVSAVRRRPLDPGHEALINYLGLALLVLLVVVITIRDIAMPGGGA